MDKRILKTKANIKQTLTAMLADQTFDEIAVSDLCKRGHTTRMTFYTYYSDKYALADEMMKEYYAKAVAIYHALQKPEKNGDAMSGYNNLLECILRVYDENYDFFSHISPSMNPYLYSSFYRYTFTGIEDYLSRHTALRTSFSSNVIAALLCGGLWSVIQECYETKMSHDELRMTVRTIYRSILKSGLFS